MIDQIGIACLGVTAVFLTQSKSERVRRCACLVGMASQPFWIYAAWAAGQWGILIVNGLYTVAWGKGIWTHWIGPRWFSKCSFCGSYFHVGSDSPGATATRTTGCPTFDRGRS